MLIFGVCLTKIERPRSKTPIFFGKNSEVGNSSDESLKAAAKLSPNDQKAIFKRKSQLTAFS